MGNSDHVYVVQWSEIPIVPSYPHYPQDVRDETCKARSWPWLQANVLETFEGVPSSLGRS